MNDRAHPAANAAHCPVCHGSTTRPVLASLYDDRYGYPGSFGLVECSGCTHRFLVADFTNDEITTLYSEYYPRSSLSLDDHKPPRERGGFGAWLDGATSSAYRWVPRDVKVLDIGCGFGETLGYHKARGCEVTGVEVDENIRRVAERFDYDVHVGKFDPSEFPAESFDWVTLDQVLEHVQAPVDVLAGVASVLRPDGRAVLSVPNADGWGARVFGRRWIHWHTPYHLNFFTDRSMRVAAERCGLVIERATTRTTSSWLQFQWMHLLSRPAAGERSTFWANDWRYNRLQRLGVKAVELAARVKLNHWATRLFDALQLGDNRIYFLRRAQ